MMFNSQLTTFGKRLFKYFSKPFFFIGLACSTGPSLAFVFRTQDMQRALNWSLRTLHAPLSQWFPVSLAALCLFVSICSSIWIIRYRSNREDKRRFITWALCSISFISFSTCMFVTSTIMATHHLNWHMLLLMPAVVGAFSLVCCFVWLFVDKKISMNQE